MTIKQNGGVFGRNPTFNDVTIEGQLTFEGDIDISSDLKVSGDLDVTGGMTVDGSTLVVDDSNNRVGVGTDTPDTVLEVVGSSPILTVRDTSTNSATANATLRLAESGAAGSLDQYFDIKATNGKIEFIDQWNEGGGTGTRLTLTDAGSLQINTAGQGIDFSATAGTGTSELLSDYEEGVWTPTVGGDATYHVQDGYYVKIGTLVYVQGKIQVNVLGTGSATTVSGLPFPAINAALSSAGTGSSSYFGALATSVTTLVPYVNNATSTVIFGSLGAAGVTMTGITTVFQNSARIDFSLSYRST